jgi:predicted permease
LGQNASPLALIVLVALLSFMLSRLKNQIILGTFLRSFLAPSLVLGTAVILL